MKYIIIVAAMDEEINAIKEKFNNLEKGMIKNLYYWSGTINEKNYILTKSGIGKVNAARTTQIFIDNFDVKYVINIGSAGAINEELDIGDIVIGTKLVQHDFDTTAFGDEKGYITGIGKIFESDENLISKYKEYLNSNIIHNKNIFGTIATGDVFCTDNDMKLNIKKQFGADCVDMEGAAIAQVCTLDKKPFLVIRSISDKVNGKNQIDFNKYIKLASKRCADFVFKI